MPPNLPALLRSILSVPRPNQHLANFSTLRNPKPAGCPPEKHTVVTYLVKSCGLLMEDAIAASKSVHFDSPAKPNAFMNLLQNEGFTKPQISNIVKAYPRFLVTKPETYVLPKIQFFLQSFAGVPKQDVLATISKYPCFLATSLECKLAPNFEYLKNLIGPEKAAALFRHGSRAFTRFDLNRVIPNVDYLREIGVTTSSLELALKQCSGIFSLEHNELRKIVQEVRGMGFEPERKAFVLAVHARSAKSCLALWDRCYQVYVKWGWSRDEIMAAFLRHPNCLLCSEKKVNAVLEFVVRELGREARSVARYPGIIPYSMENRIVPRCRFVRDLASKDLVKKDWNLNTVLGLRERDFMERYVSRFAQEAPELCERYASRKERDGEPKLGSAQLVYSPWRMAPSPQSANKLADPSGGRRLRLATAVSPPIAPTNHPRPPKKSWREAKGRGEPYLDPDRSRNPATRRNSALRSKEPYHVGDDR
ncbi:mitochondrial transcription termination factorfamily protein [Striga asiatica]|uniref:Mitochondrial transcription termination factorfamily protein n=1 Tax=Striga asiatica TaxID=4170 RepID=A0A5A7PR40_STRAF|nr:mitochondrial transcription termination factorfamily protein [Striga asiatica]